MKPALIFDLDGTLWDASAQITVAWRLVGQKYFGPDYRLTVEQVKGLMGKTMSEIAFSLTPKGAPIDKAKTFVDECFVFEREYLEGHPGVLFDGELEALEELSQDYDLYIVSNCQAGYIETFLPLVRPGLFLDHKCWSDTQKEKQFTIRLLMDLHGIECAAYIGDTAKDEAATIAAGIPFVFAAYGFGSAENPDAVAQSVSDLPRAVRALCLR